MSPFAGLNTAQNINNCRDNPVIVQKRGPNFTIPLSQEFATQAACHGTSRKCPLEHSHNIFQQHEPIGLIGYMIHNDVSDIYR
jgi:hypothetical protein